MKKIVSLPALAILASFGLVSTASAQLIVFNSSDYVSGSAINARNFVVSGTTSTLSFSDVNSLAPTSGYVGPAFFGGAAARNPGGTGFSGPVSSVSPNGTPTEDRIQLSVTTAGVSSRTLDFSGLLYFKSGSAFDITANNQFSSSLTRNFNSATGIQRWLVRNGSGALYVSNETFDVSANNPLTTATSTGLTSTTWALLDTSGSHFYNTFGTFESINLTGLTGAGVYWTAERTATGPMTAGVRLNTFTVVPEPSTAAMLLGGFGALLVLRCFRRIR